MGDDGNPQPLSTNNKEVFEQLEKLSDNKLWLRIRPLAVTSYRTKVATKKNHQVKKSGAKYFSSEFSGVKKTRGREDSETNVYHGLVVDSLKKFIERALNKKTRFYIRAINLSNYHLL